MLKPAQESRPVHLGPWRLPLQMIGYLSHRGARGAKTAKVREVPRAPIGWAWRGRPGREYPGEDVSQSSCEASAGNPRMRDHESPADESGAGLLGAQHDMDRPKVREMRRPTVVRGSDCRALDKLQKRVPVGSTALRDDVEKIGEEGIDPLQTEPLGCPPQVL